MFYQKKISAQVKRCAIITYKYGICEFPHEFRKSLKTSLNDSLVTRFPANMKVLLILAKNSSKAKVNFSRSVLLHMKTKVSLKYFVNGFRLVERFYVNGQVQGDCNLLFSHSENGQR